MKGYFHVVTDLADMDKAELKKFLDYLEKLGEG